MKLDTAKPVQQIVEQYYLAFARAIDNGAKDAALLVNVNARAIASRWGKEAGKFFARKAVAYARNHANYARAMA